MILGIIKVEICFISQDRGLRLITFTATLIISDITDSECIVIVLLYIVMKKCIDQHTVEIAWSTI